MAFHGDSEASNTYPAQASSLRKGGFIVINKKPCKIVQMTRSQPGKHGHAKTSFVGLDIFTGKKLQYVVSSTHNVEVPNVRKQEYKLVNVSGEGYVTLMNELGELRSDLKLRDDDLGSKIRDKFNDEQQLQVTVQSAMGEEVIVATKTPATRRP